MQKQVQAPVPIEPNGSIVKRPIHCIKNYAQKKNMFPCLSNINFKYVSYQFACQVKIPETPSPAATATTTDVRGIAISLPTAFKVIDFLSK